MKLKQVKNPDSEYRVRSINLYYIIIRLKYFWF